MRGKKRPKEGCLFKFTEEDEEDIQWHIENAVRFMKNYGKGRVDAPIDKSKYYTSAYNQLYRDF